MCLVVLVLLDRLITKVYWVFHILYLKKGEGKLEQQKISSFWSTFFTESTGLSELLDMPGNALRVEEQSRQNSFLPPGSRYSSGGRQKTNTYIHKIILMHDKENNTTR